MDDCNSLIPTMCGEGIKPAIVDCSCDLGIVCETQVACDDATEKIIPYFNCIETALHAVC